MPSKLVNMISEDGGNHEEETPLELPAFALAAESETTNSISVLSYTNINNLAHQPRGTASANSITHFSFDSSTGDLTEVAKLGASVENPGFGKQHPNGKILYVVTESVEEEGWLVALKLSETTQELEEVARIATGGRSACYIELNTELTQLFVINYFDREMLTIDIDRHGMFIQDKLKIHKLPTLPDREPCRPHGDNDHNTQRFKETHPHCLTMLEVLVDDSTTGTPVLLTFMYVPDLGESCVKQMLYFQDGGLAECGRINDIGGNKYGGPRYMSQVDDCCYLVNELSNEVVVYKLERERAQLIYDVYKKTGEVPQDIAVLKVIQTIKTIPDDFPNEKSTCGVIFVENQKKWVLVSNRGHDSIACYRRNEDGTLQKPLYCDCAGKKPRHFMASACSKWLFVGNQDSDEIALFKFDVDTGKAELHSKTSVNSPNFIMVGVGQNLLYRLKSSPLSRAQTLARLQSPCFDPLPAATSTPLKREDSEVAVGDTA